MRRAIVGCRVPRAFFVTSGVGESDITVHAGSYHLALRDAGIEMCNIMAYSSILPAVAREYPRDDHAPVHGAVLETITAVATAEYGSTATAGLIWGWLLTPEGARAGGLVAEYSGSLAAEAATAHLNEMLNELHVNGYEHYRLVDRRVVTRSVAPIKMYGTALVALCFTEYEWPMLAVEEER